MYVISHNVTHEICVGAIARAGVTPKLPQKGPEQSIGVSAGRPQGPPTQRELHPLRLTLRPWGNLWGEIMPAHYNCFTTGIVSGVISIWKSLLVT